MRFLIPAAVAAALLLPTAAMACPNCIIHGSEREDKTWSQIVGRKNPLIPAPATESTKVTTPQAKKAASNPKTEAPAKATK
ncbi:hypothetical protein D3C86_392020 [compost metagenome]